MTTHTRITQETPAEATRGKHRRSSDHGASRRAERHRQPTPSPPASPSDCPGLLLSPPHGYWLVLPAGGFLCFTAPPNKLWKCCYGKAPFSFPL